MTFETLVGNSEVKAYLTSLLAADAWGCPLLLSGTRSVGKFLTAQLLARELLGSDTLDHPDLRIVSPEGKGAFHSMETLRQVRYEAQQAPYQAKRRVIILDEADRVRPESANALLKTFEEPLETTILILTTSQPERLLPTILSRCQMVRFRPVSAEDISPWLNTTHGIELARAAQSALLAEGAPGVALQLANSDSDGGRTTLLQILARGGFRSYSEAQHFLESIKEGLGNDSTETAESPDGIEVSAVQKAALLKAEDGRATLSARGKADWLFDTLALWYRDLELHNVGAEKGLLVHQDFAQASTRAFQQGYYKRMDEVLDAISTARMALERSSPLNSVLETLFLRLGLL